MQAPAPSPVEPGSVDAVVFDLGGVLLDLDFSRTIDALGALFEGDASRLYTQLSQVALFDQFERGEIEAAAFRRGLAHLFGRGDGVDERHVDDQRVDAAWNALLGDIPEAKLSLLASLRTRTRVFLLSNTNSIHIDQFLLDYAARHATRFGPWSELFETDYYSHLMGLRKPEASIFEFVLRTHGLAPSRTLFIDDNVHNVEAAAALGMPTRHHPSNAPLSGYFSAWSLDEP